MLYDILFHLAFAGQIDQFLQDRLIFMDVVFINVMIFLKRPGLLKQADRIDKFMDIKIILGSADHSSQPCGPAPRHSGH
jgi:hypothetical protein